jgi:hypothetical protein
MEIFSLPKTVISTLTVQDVGLNVWPRKSLTSPDVKPDPFEFLYLRSGLPSLRSFWVAWTIRGRWGDDPFLESWYMALKRVCVCSAREPSFELSSPDWFQLRTLYPSSLVSWHLNVRPVVVIRVVDRSDAMHSRFAAEPDSLNLPVAWRVGSLENALRAACIDIGKRWLLHCRETPLVEPGVAGSWAERRSGDRCARDIQGSWRLEGGWRLEGQDRTGHTAGGSRNAQGELRLGNPCS